MKLLDFECGGVRRPKSLHDRVLKEQIGGKAYEHGLNRLEAPLFGHLYYRLCQQLKMQLIKQLGREEEEDE